MKIDWNYVKKKTLWPYEELLQKICVVLDFDFVQKHYNHAMEKAAAYSERLQHGYRQNGREAEFINEITGHFRSLSRLNILNYRDLIWQIDTREKCEIFIKRTGIPFEALIQMLNFIFRWILPFRCPVKELMDLDDPVSAEYMDILKQYRISSNLDVLQNLHTKQSAKLLPISGP